MGVCCNGSFSIVEDLRPEDISSLDDPETSQTKDGSLLVPPDLVQALALLSPLPFGHVPPSEAS